MTTTDSDSQIIQLNEGDKKELLSEELQTPLDELSSELEGYSLNSERKEAWISKIIPPEESEVNKTITVEYLLPSTDTITETYEYPNKRWPDENLFKKILEETGNTPSTLKMALGESVNIAYDDRKDRWVTEVKYNNNKTESNSSSTSKQDKIDNFVKEANFVRIIVYAMITMSLGFFLIVLTLMTRGVGLFLIVFVFISILLISDL